MADVICIRGAPGVGKSTAAKILAATMEKGVRLEVDKIRSMRIDVCWTHQRQHVEGLEIAAELCASFLNREWGPVIVVDTFSKGKLAAFLQNLSPTCPYERVKVFTLWARPEILRERVASRPPQQYQDEAVCEALNRECMNPVVPGDLVIDTSHLLPADVAMRIQESCGQRPTCPGDFGRV